MAKKTRTILTSTSAAELKRMLAAKQKIEKLEATKKKIESDLAKVDKEIEKLLGGGTAKKTRKKATRKKAAKKATRRKTTKKKVVAKKAGRKPTKKVPRKKTTAGPKLEDVIIKVIKAGGKKMKYTDIRDTITKKKLYKSKSKNFDNVLRRTISTAKGVKRVARGVYSAK